MMMDPEVKERQRLASAHPSNRVLATAPWSLRRTTRGGGLSVCPGRHITPVTEHSGEGSEP